VGPMTIHVTPHLSLKQLDSSQEKFIVRLAFSNDIPCNQQGQIPKVVGAFTNMVR